MPNAAYMKIGDRYTGRLVFPTLYEQGMSKDATAQQVPLQILEDVFQIFTSTLIELQETEQAHLTVNYGAESSRQSRMGGGPPGQGTHAIAPDILEPLTRQVLVKIRQQQWGKDAFWFHEFRGMRAANVSRLEDLPQRPEDIFTRRFKVDILSYMVNWQDWLFDVGTEFMLAKQVLMFRRDSFPLLMQKVLNLAENDSHAVVHTAKFHWDPAALLTDAGGFRFTPARQDRDRCGVHYVQGYSTEKHQIYSLGRTGIAAHLTFKDFIVNGADGYTEQLITAWSDTALAASSWNARLEMRVRGDRLDLADRLEFSLEEIERCFFTFSTPAFFRFKAIRLHALSFVLTSWRQCTDIDTKVHSDSLHLLFACIWSINALNSRPADMATDRALSNAVCPHHLNRSDRQWIPVLNHYGMHFLAGLNYHLNRNGGVAYLMGDSLDLATLQPLAGSSINLSHLRQYFSKRSAPNDIGSQLRPPKRRNLVMNNKISPRDLMEPPHGFVNPFTLDQQGYTTEDGASVDDALGRIYCQFQFDMVFKLPICSGRSQSYERCNRDRMAQDHWHQVMHRNNTADVFQLCAFAPNSSEGEFRRVYDLCFADEPSEVSQGTQNWRDLKYNKVWAELFHNVDKEVWKAARKEMFAVWCEQLAWVPCARGNRVWSTKRGDMRAGIREHSDDGMFTGACPIILLNPLMRPKPGFTPETITPMREW
jgi:hypothetical protein